MPTEKYTVTVPDRVAEGQQFQANTPSGPMIVTVPPGVTSGETITISVAPAPAVIDRTALGEASKAMVGTWESSQTKCCGCTGLKYQIFITESNGVLTRQDDVKAHACCMDWEGEGSGSRGVNDTSMTMNFIMQYDPTTSARPDITHITTITSATSDKVETEYEKKTVYGYWLSDRNSQSHGTESWDLAANTLVIRGRRTGSEGCTSSEKSFTFVKTA